MENMESKREYIEIKAIPTGDGNYSIILSEEQLEEIKYSLIKNYKHVDANIKLNDKKKGNSGTCNKRSYKSRPRLSIKILENKLIKNN